MPKTLDELAQESGVNIDEVKQNMDMYGTTPEAAIGNVKSINRPGFVSPFNYGAKPVGLISTKTAGNQVKSDLKSFNEMTGQQNVPTQITPKTTKPTTEIKQEEPQQKEDSGYTLEEAMNIWGEDMTGLSYNPNTKRLTPDESALERAGLTGFDIETDENQRALQDAVKQTNYEIDRLVSDLQTYNVDNDPEYQNATNDIRSQYEKLRQDMIQINESRAKRLETIGMRNNTTRYAGNVQSGIEGEELKQANERLAEISRQEQSAITAARKAYRDGAYLEFNTQVNALKDIRDSKQQQLSDYQTAIADYNKNLLDREKFDFDVYKYQNDLEQKDMTDDMKEYEMAKNEGFDGTWMDYQVWKEGLSSGFVKPTADIQEYEYAKNNGYQGSWLDYQTDMANLKETMPNMPNSYQEWYLAGGEVGTGKSYAEFLQKEGTKGPVSYQEWELAGGKAGTGKTYAEFIAKSSGLDTSTANKVQQIAGQFDNEQIVKNYNTAQEGYQSIVSIGTETNSPADDIAFIYAFAKIMDPNSVVREGEYNTIQKYAQSWAESFGFKAKRIFSNTNFLSTDAKNKMLQALTPRINTVSTQYDNVYSEYIRRINKITGASDGKDYITDYAKPFRKEETLKSYYSELNGQQKSDFEEAIISYKQENPGATEEQILAALTGEGEVEENKQNDTNFGW